MIFSLVMRETRPTLLFLLLLLLRFHLRLLSSLLRKKTLAVRNTHSNFFLFFGWAVIRDFQMRHELEYEEVGEGEA